MAKYKYPNTLSPSTLLILALHQRGADFSDMGDCDVSGVLDQIQARTLAIDTGPEAVARVLRAMQEADDRKAGRVRLWIDDLLPDPPALVVQE